MPPSRKRHVALSLSLPADHADDVDFRRLVALLRKTSLSLRDGREGTRTELLVASWPDDAQHEEHTALARRLLGKYSGSLGGAAAVETSTGGSPAAPNATG